MKKVAVCGAAAPRSEMMEDGFWTNCCSWLTIVPAMRDVKKTVKNCTESKFSSYCLLADQSYAPNVYGMLLMKMSFQ